MEAKCAKGWHDTRCDFYSGTKADLISRGFCKPEWFPEKLVPELRKDGKPRLANNGQPRLKRTYAVAGQSPEIRLRHRVDAYGNEFWTVECRVSKEEEERRSARYQAEWERQEQQRDYNAALSEQEKELSHMPKSHEQYRRNTLRWFETMYEDLAPVFFGESKYHGYSFAPEVLEAIDLKLQEIRNILETGETIYSPERQQARIASLKARTAEADPAFHGFLCRVTKSSDGSTKP